MLSRFALTALTLLACAATQADTTLVYDEGGRQSLLRIAAGKVRFDNARDGNWLLFDAARREMTLVEPARRQYTPLDEARLAELQATVDSVVNQLQAQLAGLPPAMREQMQQMMGGVLPDQPGGEALRLEATGRGGEAAGYRCDYSRVVTNGQLRAEVCLAAVSALDIPAEDQATVREWQQFAKAMVQHASRYVSVDAGLLGGDGRLPLIYSYPGSGKPAVLQEVSRAPVDAGAMQVPAGFTEAAFGLPGS